MSDHGLKISKPGVNVLEAEPEELVFSSKYKTMRIESRGSGTVNSSVSSGLVTIPHRLGYVPMFMVHVDPNQTGNYVMAPYKSTSGNQVLSTYADETNLYIKATADTTTSTYTIGDIDDNMAREVSGVGTFTGGWGVGQTSGGGIYYGAVRFTGVASTNFISASLSLYIDTRDGTGDVKMTLWGIDEDNTAAFDTGTPATGRTKTTASDNLQSNFGAGNIWEFDATDQVAEIFGRGGWSSGNALGLQFWDNGTAVNNVYYQLGSGTNTTLEVVGSTSTVANYKYTIFKNQLE